MITPMLIQLFETDLNRLSAAINLYKDEESLWELKESMKISGGNLCLHTTGNLLHFIGAVLGESGFVRNRNAEFTLKNIPRQKLQERIDDTKTVVRDTLEQISKKELDKIYPQQILDEPVPTKYFLLYLLNQLNYHLGQIDYHRELSGSLVPAAI